jgi:hypothetical protein
MSGLPALLLIRGSAPCHSERCAADKDSTFSTVT